MNQHRYKEGDLRRPWSPRPQEVRRAAPKGGKANELVAIAWAHFAKATTRMSPAAQLALETMNRAVRLASGHGASVETMISVGQNADRLRAAMRELPA